jgi:hypothetical protein
MSHRISDVFQRINDGSLYVLKLGLSRDEDGRCKVKLEQLINGCNWAGSWSVQHIDDISDEELLLIQGGPDYAEYFRKVEILEIKIKLLEEE